MKWFQALLNGLLAVMDFIALALVSAFFVGFIVMLLWNWLVPVIVPAVPIAKSITYWQGWGLCFLLRMLLPTKTGK